MPNVLKAIPGLGAVAEAATEIAQAKAAKEGRAVTLHNFHLLRQSAELMSGSSFSYHVDLTDTSLLPLEYTVSVKLTEDPAQASGSWMKMAGGTAMPYGKEARSGLVFSSSAMHMSLDCEPEMGTVLKAVFFFQKV